MSNLFLPTQVRQPRLRPLEKWGLSQVKNGYQFPLHLARFQDQSSKSDGGGLDLRVTTLWRLKIREIVAIVQALNDGVQTVEKIRTRVSSFASIGAI